MSLNTDDSDSDDDWFNKDETELLKDLKIKVDEAKNETVSETEYIQPVLPERHVSTAATSDEKSTSTNLPTSVLRKLVDMQSLDVFLYAYGQRDYDFLVNCIHISDSMKRVFLYLRCLAMIVNLKVPAFHNEVLIKFINNEILLNHIVRITEKIFDKRYVNNWKTDKDKMQLDQAFYNVQTLLLEAHTIKILTPKAVELISSIHKFLKKSDCTEIVQRKTCTEFEHKLLEILTENANEKEGNCLTKNMDEIYPTLSELLGSTSSSSTATENLTLTNYAYKSVNEYLCIQQNALRDDFMHSLINLVRQLREAKELSPTTQDKVLYIEDVEIVLNNDFINARRHEMLFIDTKQQAQKKCMRNKIKTHLRNLKTGSLLCLTTNYDFDNLILAVVTYQDLEIKENGYIAIEIARQFNIGNIYNKNFIVFSSPAFFEPYHNVYNYLRTCSIDDFPMREQIVYGKNTEKSGLEKKHENLPKDVKLNTSQKKALEKALNEDFVLIQGPPGTGKTHLSVQLVQMLIERNKRNKVQQPIVVVAYTNDSLDKFLLKICRYTTKIARFGSQTRLREIARYNVDTFATSENVNRHLKRLFSTVKTSFQAAFEHLQLVQNEFDGTDDGYELVLAAQRKVHELTEQLNTIRIFFKYYNVLESELIAMTTTCAAKMNFLFRLLGCQVVIFEEAAEILESHVLACLTPQTEHIIMIGDHMQLKPYTAENKHSRSCDLSVSLFERLICQKILEPAVLNTQYRMRPVIAQLMHPIFYEELYNHPMVELYPSVRGMEHNLYFLSHNHPETKEDSSYYNTHETNEIISLAKHLIKKAKYRPDEIVILSPYARQCNVLKSNLLHNMATIRVLTVDSFQGQEAEIILLSLVRSNDDGHIGFLQEKNRVCVALSRAKYGLYITGNLEMLSSCNQTWAKIKEKLEAQNLVGKEFPCKEKIIFDESAGDDL